MLCALHVYVVPWTGCASTGGAAKQDSFWLTCCIWADHAELPVARTDVRQQLEPLAGAIERLYTSL